MVSPACIRACEKLDAKVHNGDTARFHKRFTSTDREAAVESGLSTACRARRRHCLQVV